MNPKNLKEEEQKRINVAMNQRRLQRGKVYRLVLLQEILDTGRVLSYVEGKAELQGWLRWALKCRIVEM
jgi:hypothetical protein